MPNNYGNLDSEMAGLSNSVYTLGTLAPGGGIDVDTREYIATAMVEMKWN